MSVLILKKDAPQNRIRIKDLCIITGYNIMPGTCAFFKKEIKITVLLINVMQDDMTNAQTIWFTSQNLFYNNMQIYWILIVPSNCQHILKSKKIKQLLTFISETKHTVFKLIETNETAEFPQDLIEFINSSIK